MSANVFVTLPFLAGNGPGAAVDVSAMGVTKTVIAGGAFHATVTIEYSTAPSGNLWAPVPNGSFGNPGGLVTILAVQRMRAVTSGYVSGAADVSVGAPASPSAAVQLTGAPLDVSALPPFKTVVVDGACNVELSEDGVSYSQVFSFSGAGGQSGLYAAQFARVTNGVTCWMGSGSFASQPSDSGAVLSLAFRNRTILDALGAALSSDVVIDIAPDNPERVPAAELNAAPSGTFTRTFQASLETIQGLLHSWANIIPALTPTSACADPDIGPPAVIGTPSFIDGYMIASIAFDTDAGATKTYAPGDSVGVAIFVQILGFPVPISTKTYIVF